MVSSGLSLANVFCPRFYRYNILAADIMAKAKSDKVAAKGLFESVGLEVEKYRLGHTKARKSTLSNLARGSIV